MNCSFFLFAVTIFCVLASACSSGVLSDEMEKQLSDQIEQENPSKAEEEAGLFEGDIDMDPREQEALTSQSDAIKFRRKHWPGGKMYYAYHRNIRESVRQKIRRAMDHIKLHTCIRFSYRKKKGWWWTRRHYVQFYKGTGCRSKIGLYRKKRMQRISIGSGCTRLGTIVHEIMHALGFYHEQSRQDRDRYVRIFWSEIKKGKEHNFKKYPKSKGKSLNTPYDYASVMHYGKKAFAKGKKPTILPNKKDAKIGQRYGLSCYDVLQINRLYNCKAHLRCRDRDHPYKCAKVKHKCRKSSNVRRNCKRTCGRC